MCEKPPNGDFHHPDCMKRKCESCGIHNLDEIFRPLMTQGKKAAVEKMGSCYTTNAEGSH